MYNHKEVEQKWAKVRDERKEYKCDTYDFYKDYMLAILRVTLQPILSLV